MRRLALAALPALLLTAGCGSLDTSKSEQAIRSDLERATGARAVKVDCPEDVDRKQDENFTCTATVDGQRIQVPVRQTDDEGTISYEPQLIATQEVERNVEQRANRRLEESSGAEAQCPTVVPLDPGSSFECQVETPGPDFTAKVTQGSGGRVSIELER